MPKEQNFKGKKCRYYRDGYVWVSQDGTVIAYHEKTTQGRWGWPVIKTRYPRKKKSVEGKVYIEARFGQRVSVARAVITCWCSPKPDDGKTYMISHKDGNESNNNAFNLEWVPYHYKHTQADSKNIQYGDLAVTVSKDGTIKVGDNNVPIIDYRYDPDVDRHWCPGIEAVLYTKESGPNGKPVDVDELMKLAGYIQGDDADMISPVILHKDMDWKNFSSDNLEFVEASDPRYLNYQEIVKENRKQRTIELNPGKQLPSNWL